MRDARKLDPDSQADDLPSRHLQSACLRSRNPMSNQDCDHRSRITSSSRLIWLSTLPHNPRELITNHASPTDAAHSTNTLNYVQPFRVPPIATATSPLDPRTWSHEEFKQWVAKNSRIIDPNKLAHAKESGKVMVMLPESEWIKRVVHVDSSAKASEPPSSATVSKLYMMFWKMVGECTPILMPLYRPAHTTSSGSQSQGDW